MAVRYDQMPGPVDQPRPTTMVRRAAVPMPVPMPVVVMLAGPVAVT